VAFDSDEVICFNVVSRQLIFWSRTAEFLFGIIYLGELCVLFLIVVETDQELREFQGHLVNRKLR